MLFLVIPGLLLVVPEHCFCHIPLKDPSSSGVTSGLFLTRGLIPVRKVVLNAALGPGLGSPE